ncbi:MAG: hypothetical protein JNK53_06180 [Phycisphaerae bacterium]|nr:hypothetical protein [Phycisphaerae bacterium]
MIAVCDAVLRSVKQSGTPRTLFDAAMVRLALAARFSPTDDGPRTVEPPAKKAPRP